MTKRRSLQKTKYDWDKIREEYVSGGITLVGLSKKYGVPFNTVGSRSAREGWKALQVERREGGASEKLERLKAISEVLTKKISDAVSDEMQFNRYLISEKASDEKGKPITVTSERCFDKLDIRALKEMTATLKVLSECVKELYDIKKVTDDDDDGDDENEITVRFIDADRYAD